jgi:DNA-directed RNA polymerase specialized sigma24 family protein
VIAATVTDEALAARARDGDDAAFEELALRYRRVIGAAIRRPGFGMGWEDEHQEALIGLFNACRAHRPERGRFASLAAVCIRNRVRNARTRGRLPRHRIVNEAIGLDHTIGEGGPPLAERIPAGDRGDPAVVVELREELARLAVEGERRREPAPRKPPSTPPRRYSEREIGAALALVAEGKTLREAGAAVGAPHSTVSRWLRKAA